LILLPQFISVTQQEDIIAGHSFPTYLSKKRGLYDAVFQHSRHLNDFPYQYALIGLALVGGLILLWKKVWWPLAVWLLLIVVNVDAGTPLGGGPVGVLAGGLGEFFYKDPRRIAAATTLLLMPTAGLALFVVVVAGAAGVKRLADRVKPLPAPGWTAATVVVLVLAILVSARQYLWRHIVLFGNKYDSVIVDNRDLAAMAHLATLPGARDTTIGNSNVDGTAWMYAVAGLHPLWTHYDFPQQTGPGYYRYVFWAHAREGTQNPSVVEAVRALNIRYILTSEPTVRGFAEPEGIRSLEKSESWAEIYNNGGAQIWEWRGTPAAPHS
jgi:D-galactosaminyltransferase